MLMDKDIKKLGFGCMRLPLGPSGKEEDVDVAAFKEMVDRFMARGFNYFDTAWMYHAFRSEDFVWQALVERYPREDFWLVDKLPLTMMAADAGFDEAERIFEQQLAKCGVDYFDVYLMHNITPSNYAKAVDNNWFEFLRGIKADGRAHRIGISAHCDADFLSKVLAAQPEIEIVQLQLNYLDWENPRIQSRLCYETARRFGKQVVVMEPNKGGMLIDIPDEAERVLHASGAPLTNAGWAIKFAASQEGVLTVLSGMSNLAQLEDNMSFMEDFKPFGEAEFAVLRRVVDIINDSIAIPCTGCKYCLDGCPMEIAIPEFFALYNSRSLLPKADWYPEDSYYEGFTADHAKASDCIACGACENACPQGLEIIKNLRAVAEAFESD